MSPEGFDALARRTRNASRRLINQGAGLFLLAIVLTASLAVSLRVAIPRFVAWERAVANYVGLIFQSELETTPTRSIRPVIATITSIIESQKLLDCDASEMQCPAVRAAQLALKKVTQAEAELTDFVRDRCGVGDQAGPSCIESRMATLGSGFVQATSGISQAELELLVMERLKNSKWRDRASAMVTDCNNLVRAAVEKPTGRSALLPSAGCDAAASTNGTTTVIPQQLANADGSKVKYTDRVLAALVESRTFDHVVAAIDAAAPHPLKCEGASASSALCGQRQEDSEVGVDAKSDATAVGWSSSSDAKYSDDAGAGQLVQAYYISPDSILRIWSPRIDEEQFPGNRLWSQGPYAFRLLNSDLDNQKTGIYVDTGGNGLVRTYCYPVEAPLHVQSEMVTTPLVAQITRQGRDGNSTKAPPRLFGDGRGNERSSAARQQMPELDGRLAANKVYEGEICVDVALRAGSPEFRRLLQALTKNPMVDSSIVSIRISATNRVEGLSLPDGKPLPNQILGLPSAELLSRLLEREDTEVGHYVTDHWIAGVPVVLMPVARQSDREVLAFIMKPKGLSPPVSLLVSGGLACLSLLGTGITLFLLGASRRESELDSQIGRLRSLPVGVLETDLMHNVIAANDRAEEMVNRRLPKIGVLGYTRAVKFDDLFDPRGLYSIDVDDAAPEGMKLTTMTEEELRERRLAGARSQYYARLKTYGDSEVWLRLVAIPLLPLSAVRTESATNSRDPKYWMPAFGVLLDCSKEDLNAIRKKRAEVDQQSEQQKRNGGQDLQEAK